MGIIQDRLAGHTAVGLDTSILIYQVEGHPRYSSLAREILAGIESGQWAGVTSVITLLEITVQPLRLGRFDVAREYEALLAHFPNLNLVDLTRDVARHAAQLRARYQIGTPDAIQVASSISKGATVFVTNDRRLGRLAAEIEVIILEELAQSESGRVEPEPGVTQ